MQLRNCNNYFAINKLDNFLNDFSRFLDNNTIFFSLSLNGIWIFKLPFHMSDSRFSFKHHLMYNELTHLILYLLIAHNWRTYIELHFNVDIWQSLYKWNRILNWNISKFEWSKYCKDKSIFNFLHHCVIRLFSSRVEA